MSDKNQTTGNQTRVSAVVTTMGLELLAVLDEVGGFETGQIAQKVDPRGYGYNARIAAGGVRSRLVQMQRSGLVGLLDDQKPACWIRTAEGTKILQERTAP